EALKTYKVRRRCGAAAQRCIEYEDAGTRRSNERSVAESLCPGRDCSPTVVPHSQLEFGSIARSRRNTGHNRSQSGRLNEAHERGIRRHTKGRLRNWHHLIIQKLRVCRPEFCGPACADQRSSTVSL